MNLKIESNNIKYFVDAIIHFIIEEFEILPITFEPSSYEFPVKFPLKYHESKLIKYKCDSFYKNNLHYHDSKLIFCTEPELFAAQLIDMSVYRPLKKRNKIFETLKQWLPTVTWSFTKIIFTPYDISGEIHTDLFPYYAQNIIRNLNIEDQTEINNFLLNTKIIFHYYIYDDDNDNLKDDKEIDRYFMFLESNQENYKRHEEFKENKIYNNSIVTNIVEPQKKLTNAISLNNNIQESLSNINYQQLYHKGIEIRHINYKKI